MVSEQKSYGLKRMLFLSVFFILIISCFVLGTPNSLKAQGDFTPNSLKAQGDYIYAASYRGEIVIWEKDSWELIDEIESPPSADEDLIYSNLNTDGTNFYFSAKDYDIRNLIYSYNMETNKWKKIKVFANNTIYNLVMDFDSNMMYINPDDNIIRVLDLEKNTMTKIGSKEEQPSYAFLLDENYIYVITWDGNFRVWDKNTHEFISEKSFDLSDSNDMIKQSAIMSMLVVNNTLYTGNVLGQIRIWDLESHSFVKEIHIHDKEVKQLLADNKFVYSFSPKTLKIMTLEGEPVEIFLDEVAEYHIIRIDIDDDYLYIGVLEGGVFVYDKSDWKLVKVLGNLTAPTSTEYYKKQTQRGINPILPIFLIFVLFFIIVLIMDVVSKVKKKNKKISAALIKKELASYAEVRDVVSILSFASIVIMILGIIKPSLTFPYHMPNLKFIYFFDILIKKGALMPIWFLLPLSLVWWATQKIDKPVKYGLRILTLAVVIILFIIMPSAT